MSDFFNPPKSKTHKHNQQHIQSTLFMNNNNNKKKQHTFFNLLQIDYVSINSGETFVLHVDNNAIARPREKIIVNPTWE